MTIFRSFSDAEIARVVLALDRDITRRRRADAMAHIVNGRPVPLPVKPTRVELGVLTALAQTYGPAVLEHADFTPVLDCIAECGAVVLVQRVAVGRALGGRATRRAPARRAYAVRDPVRDLARGVHGAGAC